MCYADCMNSCPFKMLTKHIYKADFTVIKINADLTVIQI